MFKFWKKKHECWMDVKGVDHEEIDGRRYTHVLKVCPKCGEWEVETIVGSWDYDEFESIPSGAQP